MSALVSQASKAWSKVRPLTDIRDIVRRIKYHGIRSRYFREMWATAAKNIGATYSDTPFGLAEIARGVDGVKQSGPALRVREDMHRQRVARSHEPKGEEVATEAGGRGCGARDQPDAPERGRCHHE